MMFSLKKKCLVTAFIALGVPSIFAPAQSATTFFSLSSGGYQSSSDNYIYSTHANEYDLKENQTGSTSSFSASATAPAGPWSGSAVADIAGGRLAASNMISLTGASFGSTPYIDTFAGAAIGDSFRVTDSSTGLPFNWNGASASFTFDVTGLYDVNGLTNSYSGFSLTILKAGALDGWLHNTADLPAWYAANVIGDYRYVFGEQDSSTNPANVTAYLTDFPSSVTTTFQPNGDFDFVMQLSLQAYTETPFTGAYSNQDFSHTVLASYSGPTGSTTYSGSGAFPGTGAPTGVGGVPEPASWAMMIAGFGLAGAMLRRRPEITSAIADA